MKDPKRLLDGDGTAFERALLGAIATERPSRELQRNMRLGIGLVGVGAIAKAASANWGQLVLAGVVVAGLVTGGAVVAKRDAPLPQPVIAAPAAAPAPAVVVDAPKTAAVEPIPVAAPDLPETAAPVRRATGESKAVQVGDIREEIRLLDQARSAVRSGASARALRALAKYDQKFPRGQFRQEVQVLRMEALKQSGEDQRAAALAKKFLAEHPNSPHVERVEGVGD